MYIDLLTKIKNAQQAGKKSLKVPFARTDMAILELLAKHGYINEAQKHGRMPKRIIEIKLRYDDEKGAITDVRFLSKPSRRLYAGYRDIFRVKHGYGIAVLTTPNGIVTGEEARKQKTGGQLLFEIW